MVRNRMGNILWGVFWLGIGVLLLGKIFSWWEFNFFFPGWWTLLIIIPSAIGIVKYGFGCGSTICFIIGLLMLLTYQIPEIITTELVWKLLLPVILIVVGLNIICRSLFFSRKELIDKTLRQQKPEYASVFNAQTISPGGPFYGCHLDSILGSSRLDLRNAQIETDVVINATSVFGSSDILIPPNVNVKTSSVSLFGGTENKVRNSPAAQATVYVNSISLFGGVKLV